MAALTDALDVKGVANEVVASLAGHCQISTFSSRPGGLTLAEAYRVTPLLRAAFEARGEKITGRKIGFTNREMWKAYGVQSPICRHSNMEPCDCGWSGLPHYRIPRKGYENPPNVTGRITLADTRNIM